MSAVRPLTPSEASLWWLDRAASLNFTTVARVEGPLTETALTAGLATLRAARPSFRLRIVPDEIGTPWFHAGDRALPLRTSTGTLASELEAELVDPFDWTGGPLARCVWLPESRDLLFTIQHCVGDGRSGVFAVRDLLGATAAHLRDEPPDIFSQPTLEPGDARLPRQVRRPGYWATVANLATRKCWSRLRHGAPLVAESGAALAERRVRVIQQVLEPELSAALLARARAEDTTIHGILGAIQMQATAAQGGGRRLLQFASPVDLRPYLEPPLEEAIGLYVGASDDCFPVDPESSPWELARALRACVRRDIASGAILLLNRFGPTALRHFTRGDATPLQVAQRLHALRGTTGMTNLGRVPDFVDLAPLRATALHFAVGVSALGDQVSAATGFGGRIFWNLCIGEPTIPLERAQLCWNDARARLERAV